MGGLGEKAGFLVGIAGGKGADVALHGIHLNGGMVAEEDGFRASHFVLGGEHADEVPGDAGFEEGEVAEGTGLLELGGFAKFGEVDDVDGDAEVGVEGGVGELGAFDAVIAENDLAGVERFTDAENGGAGEDGAGADGEAAVDFLAIVAGEGEDAGGVEGFAEGFGGAFADPVELGGAGFVEVGEGEEGDGGGGVEGASEEEEDYDGKNFHADFRVSHRFPERISW